MELEYCKLDLFSHVPLFLPIPDEDAKLSVVQPVISICIKLGKCNLDLQMNINQHQQSGYLEYLLFAQLLADCLEFLEKECVMFIKKFLVLT